MSNTEKQAPQISDEDLERVSGLIDTFFAEANKRAITTPEMVAALAVVLGEVASRQPKQAIPNLVEQIMGAIAKGAGGSCEIVHGAEIPKGVKH